MRTTALAALLLVLAGPARAEDAPAMPGMSSDEGEAPKEENKKTVQAAPPGGLPTEVVIKGEEGAGNKLGVVKPQLKLEVDAFESIRGSLATDESLLLAISPMTVSWRKTHPDYFYNERVIQPWRTTFSQKPGIVLRVRERLAEVLQRRMDPKEIKNWAWTLTVADEDGRVFHHYQGSSDPPEELVWSGQNDQGEWVRAGRSYSAVYTFTDRGGAPRTVVGKPLFFKGVLHQEETGLHISLDSGVLFGSNKSKGELDAPAGRDLLRAAADLVKRRFGGVPIAVRVFSQTKELGDQQGSAIFNFMLRELMATSKNVTVDAARAAYSEQRVEIVLLNR